MASQFQQNLIRFYVLAGGLALCSSAFAQTSESLAERRLGIIKRTSPGIVLLDLPGEKRPVTAAPAPTNSPSPSSSAGTSSGASSGATAGPTSTNAPASTTAATPTKAAEAAAPQPAVLNRIFSALPAPSGRSLQDARRLDAPDQGVPLPFARPTPLPAAEPEVKR